MGVDSIPPQVRSVRGVRIFSKIHVKNKQNIGKEEETVGHSLHLGSDEARFKNFFENGK